MHKHAAAILAATVLMVGACDEKADNAVGNNASATAGATDGAVTAALSKADDLSISNRLIGAAGLGTALDGKGAYTVFAPTDAAWSSLDAAELKSLEATENRPQLIAVLRQHIVPGTILAADLNQGLDAKKGIVTLATLGARPITLRREGQVIALGEGAAPRIVGAAISGGNDVVHRIDRLIPPPG